MNYKDTLNLPKTEFPMKANLTSREPEILARWERENLYGAIQESRKGAPLFVLHDGPPFANGDVHMGTALNKVLKDFIVKSKTMLGYRAPYVPGWDCHGLPIEFKVVKESRGLSPLQVRQRSEAYARKYIDIQRRQFRRLGVLGDWDRPYLTLDPAYEAEILRAFAELVRKDLVYQSRKPVFWSTGAQTALAEAEVEYHERDDPSIYVGFPIASGPLAGTAEAVIWTTTPWTLPANLAIAVHPRLTYVVQGFTHPDYPGTRRFLLARERVNAFSRDTGWVPEGEPKTRFAGSDLEKTVCRHPFLPRESIVLPGEFVTTDSGTGCVHIAPGHGEDDYVLGLKYNLPVFAPVDDNGRYTPEVGVPEWVGKYVFDANHQIVERLKQDGKLVGVQNYRHSYPHCWRSKTPVIFRAVEQFFIRIDAIRAQALAAIDGVTWLPAWGRNRMYATVESRPDWCISRQRTWGVPLPVFYRNGEPQLNADWAAAVADLVGARGSNVWYELDDTQITEVLGLPAGLTRRPDTLDVWIDSGVSHLAVLRHDPELRWPADVYIEATDQHRGWFQSSLQTSVALEGSAPYREVITHSFVVDVDSRQKISKSAQGTYARPTEAEHFVKKFGADIVRLWVSSVNYADEVPFGERMFEQLTDTYRRIRNTLRILLANLYDDTSSSAGSVSPALVDRWILGRLEQVIATCREAYAAYEFHRVYHALNHFCAVDLSSLYIDITKDRMYCDAPESPRRRATQAVMRAVYEAVTRLVAPILAFTAEEAWTYLGKGSSVHLETFPESRPEQVDASALRQVDALLRLRGLVAQGIEGARQRKEIGNGLEARVRVALPPDDPVHAVNREEVEEFLILSDFDLQTTEGEPAVEVGRTPYRRCERCWRHRPTVGSDPDYPDLCDRCAEVVRTTKVEVGR
ncbi:MAG: isoleucine--tRNA ligase [Verrucomicrobia bacterium]|nr:isoleucine--tRNA ligase [Verrucomicrobiota bacterium]